MLMSSFCRRALCKRCSATPRARKTPASSQPDATITRWRITTRMRGECLMMLYGDLFWRRRGIISCRGWRRQGSWCPKRLQVHLIRTLCLWTAWAALSCTSVRALLERALCFLTSILLGRRGVNLDGLVLRRKGCAIWRKG